MNYVLPGMGASSEMYTREWKELNNFSFLDWPMDFDGVSVSELADRIIKENKIKKDDSVYGSSLGGIVACEISNQIGIRNVTLIGSAKNKEEISTLLSVFHPLVDLAPIEFVKKAVGKVPDEMAKLLIDSEAQFIRNMCKAIFKWDGYEQKSELFRIHGMKDKVIPIPNDTNVEIDGGHLIAITHSHECIEAIKENKAGIETSGSSAPSRSIP